MESTIDLITLKKISALKVPIRITVAGTSMFPTLLSGDVITINKKSNYLQGDIIVFIDNNQKLIVHRLIKIQNKTLLCKGDNSFLLEHVETNSVLGKVIAVNRNGQFLDVPSVDDEFISLSYKVSKEFRKCGYSKRKISNNPIYVSYKERYLLK